MLVFISDNLLDPEVQKLLGADMIPITTAIADGKMYQQYRNTFTTDSKNIRIWGGNNIFGIIYQIPDGNYHIRNLDAYYGCSLSAILMNHPRDNNHRKQINVIPIYPRTLDELSRHIYDLNEPVEVWAWMVNTELKHIHRIMSNNLNRITHGCNSENFKKAFQAMNKQLTDR